MGKKMTLRPMGLKELERILTVAVVTGEGAVECFNTGGVGELYQGSIEFPARFKIKVMDFLNGDVLDDVIDDMRRRYMVSAPLIDVLVLRGDDERLLEGLMAKGRRIAETFTLNSVGEIYSSKTDRPCIWNAPKNIPGPPSVVEESTDIIFHDITDILMKVQGRSGVYIHEIKGIPGQYVLDFTQMKYWKRGSLEPEQEDRLPAYSTYRTISFGAQQYLLIAEGARADVLLHCSVRWADYKFVLEVSRPFIIGNGKTTTLYNYFLPAGRYLSPIWFNGVDTSGKSKTLDNRAYIKTLHGRQWYRIAYSGKVEKERFEPDGF